MATHDYIISNASGASVRADLNNALAAIVSNNSNATSPATTYAYQWWADTTTGQLKLRNSANNAWITIFELDGTMLMEDGTVSSPGLAFASDTNTGFFRSAADKINFATGGAERLEIGSSEVVFNDPSNDVDFRVESNGQTHMLFVEAGVDRIGIGTAAPDDVLDVRSGAAGFAQFVHSSGNGGIRISGSAASSAANLVFSNNHTGGVSDEYTIQMSGDNDRLAFRSGGPADTERMTLTALGKLGIGSTSPAATLDVAGNQIFSAANPQIQFNAGGPIIRLPSANTLAFLTDSTNEAARIDSSGRLLVGTTSSKESLSQIQCVRSSESTLSIFTSDVSASGKAKINLGPSNNITGAQIICDAEEDFSTGANRTGRLSFTTRLNGTISERMRIHSGGKLTALGVYNGTTTGGSAVYVESDGDLLRFTSSLKYKTDVETIEDARADAILNCRPVWYRSKCDNDIKTEGSEKSDWGWYGFIAEEVAEIEPRLVNWATKDAVTQENGLNKTVERDPADYSAEGVRYDNFVPLLVNLVKRQQAAIETLEAKVAALEAK